MSVVIIVTTFAIWSLALPAVIATCHLSPNGSTPGIVAATSNQQTITLTLRGDQDAIDCAETAVATASAQ